MLPTLHEILDLPAFAGAEVLTGHGQLSQRVTWVHVSEVLDAHRFLSGGELLVSTGLELANADPHARVGFLHAIAQGGAHGLVLELVRGLRELPPEMTQAARLLDFPVVVFRSEVRFADLTKAAHARILRPSEEGGEEGGLQPVLAALLETGRAEAFLQAQLGPLLRLPLRPRATLISTLDALLMTHWSVAEVARKLGVRRQTVYYRLEQIRGMLGDLEDPRRHVALSLALELCRGDSRAVDFLQGGTLYRDTLNKDTLDRETLDRLSLEERLRSP
ncbi:PucR family transcriptional regulator [Deinococcus peraridilitoris]|uniref:Transcriptional regulator, Fis family n=1 Tax=Deinococcus peraridilitoris (strain DSM 19664 / LMG 22246 / CIP 109416 / KR-200) TaxID=937777 RepID=L0A413_DEIPD|nr:PucR family transcriptional regulator [Deinococcus peraridilitoris]AFZ67765.1 transcriptional regulator, Fis family [Deinococcus peraridilitoris DSM 19664]